MPASVATAVTYGQAFVVNYSGWTGLPAGDVKITGTNGGIIELVGAVNETTPGEGTVTCAMPARPANGDMPAVLTGPGSTLELS